MWLIFVFKTVVVAKPRVSVFLSRFQFFSKFYWSVLHWFASIKVATSRTFFINLFTFAFIVLNLMFLATSLFTISLNFFKSTGTVFNLRISKSSTLVFNYFN